MTRTPTNEGTDQSAQRQSTTLKPNTKTFRVCVTLTLATLNRFDAEKIGDHCLNSTVSTLRRMGVVIVGKPEKVPTRFGVPVTVMRYSIPNSQLGTAWRVLP